MDPAGVTLILGLIKEGIVVTKEIAALACRVRNGEVISDAEIATARASVQSACQDWDAAAEHDHQ